MKILHCSDLHLGRRPVGGIGEYSEKRFRDYFDSFNYIADYAADNSVDTVIISGDIFDRREITPDILERAEKIFIKLKDSGIRTVITEGNHDRGGSNDSTWLGYLVHRELVSMPGISVNGENKFVFEPVIIDDIYFYSMGYPGIYAEEISLSLVEILENDRKNVILAHTAVSAGDYFPGTVKPQIIDLFKGKTSYIAGGHFHSFHQYPEKEPYFFVPGSPEYWDIEENDLKFFIIYDTESSEITKIDTKRRKRHEIRHSFTSVNDRDFTGEFDQWLETCKVENDSVIKCTFVISEDLYPDGVLCEKKIESAGALKAKVSFIYKRAENPSVPGDEKIITTESIEKENLVSSGYSSVISDKIVQRYLPELKKIQNEGQVPENVFEFVDSMIEDMILGGLDVH